MSDEEVFIKMELSSSDVYGLIASKVEELVEHTGEVSGFWGNGTPESIDDALYEIEVCDKLLKDAKRLMMAYVELRIKKSKVA